MFKLLEKRKTLSLILTILIAIEIFHFSSISGTDLQTGNVEGNLIPTLYHFIVFFLLAFFILATIKGNKKIKASYIFIAIIISILQAILDETHQIFVPFRSSSFGDIIIDCFGIFSAILIYLWINYKITHKV